MGTLMAMAVSVAFGGTISVIELTKKVDPDVWVAGIGITLAAFGVFITFFLFGMSRNKNIAWVNGWFTATLLVTPVLLGVGSTWTAACCKTVEAGQAVPPEFYLPLVGACALVLCCWGRLCWNRFCNEGKVFWHRADH